MKIESQGTSRKEAQPAIQPAGTKAPSGALAPAQNTGAHDDSASSADEDPDPGSKSGRAAKIRPPRRRAGPATSTPSTRMPGSVPATRPVRIRRSPLLPQKPSSFEPAEKKPAPTSFTKAPAASSTRSTERGPKALVTVSDALERIEGSQGNVQAYTNSLLKMMAIVAALVGLALVCLTTLCAAYIINAPAESLSLIGIGALTGWIAATGSSVVLLWRKLVRSQPGNADPQP